MRSLWPTSAPRGCVVAEIWLPDDSDADLERMVQEHTFEAIKSLAHPHATAEQAAAYEALLESLRKDLLLDPATELQGGVLIANAGTPLLVAIGTTTLTWSASATSANVIVSHGLPRIPKIVLAGANSTADNFYVDCFSATATTFTMQGMTATAVSLSGIAAWMAIA